MVVLLSRPIELLALQRVYKYITKVKNMPNHRLPHLAWNVGCKLQKNHKSKILSSGWVVDIRKWFRSWGVDVLLEVSGDVMHEVCRHHGLPDSIISNYGPQFVSKFWKHLFKMLKVTCNLSSGYHPQTDGQAERTNQTLEQYLRCFLSYHQDDWADILHFAEFSYNTERS